MTYRALLFGILLSTKLAAQTSEPLAGETPSGLPASIAAPYASQPVLSQQNFRAGSTASAATKDLPDAPSAHTGDAVVVAEASRRAQGKGANQCDAWHAMRIIRVDPNKVDSPPPPCSELVYPYQRFLSEKIIVPINWKQKGYLALHYTTDPAGLGTIAGVSAINIAVDSHTAYGPGLKGFGKLAGVSLLQDATGEFFGTFAVPSLTHQDPRYFRRPDKPFAKRILYSISRSYVSRSDSGRTIPNYGTLLQYPINAELSNLYVPGIHSNGSSTAERILTGLALDPANNLINEFLPDVASRVHVRIIFVQQILNNIAVSQGMP